MTELELIAGHPVLDFANLGREDVVRVAVAAGLVSAHESQHLRPGKGELGRLMELRDALRRAFGAIAAGKEPARDALDHIAREAALAARHARLRSTRKGRITRELDASSSGVGLIRFRVADAAMALLASDALPRIKVCPACAWLFLDASKNHSRRWCSMETCGGADKARRYYRKKRAT
ncbi:MAG TPA: CGNR zinc finger domain-containing protein [Thermoanaerobaculia bacterium]|nr:CGNR zinc finger domain-containing protein [Thermoanaerobaculia bacterium]